MRPGPIIDLHTHSRVSDGTQSPTELVQAAAAAGLDVLALTDHDTSGGWDEAVSAAASAGIELVRGMEISCRHRGRDVHLLAYLPDPAYEPLVNALQKILDGRNSRVPGILARLHELGIALTPDDVRRVSGDAAAVGRPHVADALVAAGVVRDREQAFDELLRPGRPAYVDRYAAPLEPMIRTVMEAGGVSVVAHAWGRANDPGPLDAAGFAELAAVGLSGIEVDHEDHEPGAREQLRAIARDLDLVVTGSSDHHGTGKTGHALGCNTTSPEEYARLLERAATAAAVSGRATPEVVTR
ncbi:PHP domain-containing protein [Nocardioides sp.]|uniref:PHP domain-containing protein n=1 Tax=Nocardioides sp. TaxID=35761 RepID=UPI002D04AAA0|nr:PHP domain-containing protein [Nocardioides sp.]HSX67661.1 PHP domain-containing protein [Nocardioides sp.]